MERLTAHYRLIAPARDEIVDVDMAFGTADEWARRPESATPGWFVIPLGGHVLAQRLICHDVTIEPDRLERDRGSPSEN